MKPILTAKMNMTYRGPNSDIGDLPCERMQNGQIRSVWEPSDEERAMITGGANIELTIFAEPIPPVMLVATYEG